MFDLLPHSIQEPMSPPDVPIPLSVEENELLPKEPSPPNSVRQDNNPLPSPTSRGTCGLQTPFSETSHSTDQQTGIQVKPNTAQTQCGNEEKKRNLTDTPVESVQPSSTPTKKSKAKRTFMKVERSHSMASSPTTPSTPHSPNNSSHLQQEQLQPVSLTTAVISVVKGEQFQRKESDDSIPESDQDHSGSTNGSDQSSGPSLTPDPEDTALSSRRIVDENSKPPSFTKEPGTGQTVPVKLGVEETECVSVGNKPKAPPTTSTSSTNTTSVSVSVGKQRSKKKQRAQQKKEEKQKKKRKEKEDICNARRGGVQEPQESFDKESVSSSTNSTDNLEEDPSTSEQTTPEEEEKKPNAKGKQDGTKEHSANKTNPDNNKKVVEGSVIISDGVKRQVGTNQGLGPKEEEKKEHSHLIEDVAPNDAKITSESSPLFQPPTSSVRDDILVEEEATLPDMETSCSSIDFKTPALSPSPDELVAASFPIQKSTPKKLEEVAGGGGSVCRSTDSSTSNKVKLGSHPSSPESRPKNSSSSLPSTPSKSPAPAPTKLRPSKLILNEEAEDQSGTSSVNSTEADGVSGRQRMPPHELAASLLRDHIPRPSKQKLDSSSSSTGGEEKDSEETGSNAPPTTTATSTRKKVSESKHADQGREKRNSGTPLSSEAIPFYPVPYHGRHPHHPHHLPPPPPPLSFPSRGPLLPSHPPHVPAPPFDYPMGRPGPLYRPVDEQMHPYDRADYERKHGKRSDTNYLPPKAFSPPTFPEGGVYHSRPSPFPQHNYDPQGEWVELRGGRMIPGYSEDDPMSISYPSGHHRGGSYLRTPHAPPPYGMPSESPRHPNPRPLSMPMEGSESVWEQHGSLTDEEILYVKQMRLQKLREKRQQQQQQQFGSDMYNQLSPLNEPYSPLASLRDRSMETQSSSSSLYQGSGRSYGPLDMENESMMNDAMIRASLEPQRLRRPSRESADLSLLLPPSAAATTPGSLNRAPGPPGSFSEPVGHRNPTPSSSGLSSLFRKEASSISQEWSNLEETEVRDDN